MNNIIKIDAFSIEIMSSKCDNNGCIGGRAFKTDESVRLDPAKEFCSYDCADEHVEQQTQTIEATFHYEKTNAKGYKYYGSQLQCISGKLIIAPNYNVGDEIKVSIPLINENS